MFNKLKQIRDMRSKAKRIQGALEHETAEGQAVWGKITVQMNGNQEILAVHLDPEYLKSEDPKKIEAAIKDAGNEALKKVRRLMVHKMRQMGELNL